MGGSWIERPRAATRSAALPYQYSRTLTGQEPVRRRDAGDGFGPASGSRRSQRSLRWYVGIAYPLRTESPASVFRIKIGNLLDGFTHSGAIVSLDLYPKYASM